MKRLSVVLGTLNNQHLFKEEFYTAMIPCPGCGEMISDKSPKCIHCGYEFAPQKKVCPECGAEAEVTASVCPKCGCPLIESDSTSTPVEVTVSKSAKKNFVKIAVAVLVVVVVALVGFVGYKASENKKAQEASEAYYENLKDVTNTMLSSAASAESAGNLIKQVWYNAIYEERNSATDKYTRPNGYFVSDFNEALGNLFSDSSFKSKISSIESNQDDVLSIMKELQNPPEEYESAYAALQNFYDDYLELTNLVTDPSGSLTTFSSNFNDADNAVSNSYGKMKLYLDN